MTLVTPDIATESIQELARILSNGYNQRQLIAALRQAPTPPDPERPLAAKHLLEHANPRKSELQQLHVLTRDNPVVILAGCLGMGKTTILQHFLRRNRDKTYFLNIGQDFGALDIRNNSHLIFDDFVPTQDISHLVSADSLHLIITTDLQHVQQLQGEYTIAPTLYLPPITKELMAQYLSVRLMVPPEDPLISFLTSLTGGSLRIANTLIAHLFRNIEAINTTHSPFVEPNQAPKMVDVISIVKDVRAEVYELCILYHHQREELPKELQQYVPIPMIFRLHELLR